MRCSARARPDPHVAKLTAVELHRLVARPRHPLRLTHGAPPWPSASCGCSGGRDRTESRGASTLPHSRFGPDARARTGRRAGDSGAASRLLRCACVSDIPSVAAVYIHGSVALRDMRRCYQR
jgi:hypothetical protein